VNAAHADIAAFISALATHVNTRANRVAEADTRFIANDADSANELAAVARPVAGG
jgi:phage protein D